MALLNLTLNTYTGVRLHNAFSKKKHKKIEKKNSIYHYLAM